MASLAQEPLDVKAGGKASDDCKLSTRAKSCGNGGAEEQRLRRMEQYAARRSDCNPADDALMADRGKDP